MLVSYLQKAPFFSRYLTVFALGISVFSGDAIEAQPVRDILPDRTLGSQSSRVERVNATRDRITGGATRGANLFHSFEKFDVSEGRAAYFANPDGIATIFSRVTGSDRSEIFGTLGVEGDANLFFINPSGIIFGPNATLDVRGAFVGSTANGIAFPNGENFSATNPGAPPLLTIDVPVPIGLRFEGTNNGIIVNQADLKAGGNFALIGAAIRSNGQISAPGGDITLATVPGAVNSVVRLEGTGEYIGRTQGIGRPNLTGRDIILTGGTIDASSNGTGGNVTFDSAGNVSFNNATFVDVRGANGGSIAVNAQNVNIAGGSQLLAGIGQGLGFRGANAGDVTLRVAKDVVLTDASRIENRVNENAIGNAGDIIIRAGSLGVFEGSVISASTFGRGNGGDITIVADGAVAIDGLGNNVSAIATTVSESAVGNAGEIDIKSRSYSQTNDTQITTFVEGASDSLSGGRGNAGDITIQTENDLTIAGFDDFFFPIVSFILTDVTSGARGNAGNITLKAGGVINLSDSVQLFAGNGGIGKSGNINLQAESVSLIDGAQLIAGNDGGGNAGNIRLQATEALNISGFDNFGNSSGLFSSIGSGQVNAGNIELQASSITLNNFAQLNTTNFGQGNAGRISLKASDRVSISNNSLIASNMNGSNAVGNAGRIAIESGSVSLTNASQIQAASKDGAQVTKAGLISIDATKAVSLTGNNTGLFANVEAGGRGNSGEIKISAPSVSISSNARLNTSNAGVGNAGKIALQVGSLSLSDRAQVLSENRGRGNAGNISIRASDRVSLNNSFISSSLNGTGVVGNVGSIAIDAGSVELNNGSQLQTAVSSSARSTKPGQISVRATDSVSLTGSRTSIFSNINPGGIGKSSNIFVSAPSVSLAQGARLDTNNSTGGNAGNITVRAQDALTVTGTDSSGNSSKITTQAGQGNAGTIDVRAGSILLRDRAALSASNTKRGSTGNILLRAKDKIFVSNSLISTSLASFDGSKVTGSIGTLSLEAGSISITDDSRIQAIINPNAEAQKAEGIFIRATDSVFLSNDAQLSTLNAGVGNAGNIKISSRTIEARNGVVIASTLVGEGQGGDIKITSTDAVSLDRSLIASNVAPNARGNGGQIAIFTRSLALNNISPITTAMQGEGNTGNIKVQASDSISLNDNSRIQASLIGVGKGGDITIESQNGLVSLNNNSDLVSSISLGAEGEGGNINIQARALSASNESQLSTATSGQGNAGSINVAVREALNFSESRQSFLPTGIFSTVQEPGKGDGGNISVKADSISLANGAQFNASTLGKGNAGNIQINTDKAIALSGISPDSSTRNSVPAGIISEVGQTGQGKGGQILVSSDSLSIIDGARITNSTFGKGNAGNIRINTDRAIVISGIGSRSSSRDFFRSGIVSQVDKAGQGNGGQILVSAGSLSITDGALISNGTLGKGNAGDIQINTDGAIALSGVNIQFSAPAGIISEVDETGQGNGGQISVSADSLAISDGALISNGTLGKGNAGDIQINTNEAIVLSGFSPQSFTGEVFSSAIASLVRETGEGRGGQISVSADSLSISDGARISNSTLGKGDAGTIQVNVRDNINLSGFAFFRVDGIPAIALSGIFSDVSSNGQGKGGNINISADSLSMDDLAAINASSAGRGDAGNILLQVDDSIRLTDLSLVATRVEEGGIGKGGDIIIQSRSPNSANVMNVILENGARISVSNFGSGVGGEIGIKTDNLTLNRALILARTASNRGGNIGLNIQDSLSLRNGSQISATAGTAQAGGDGGDININAKTIFAVPQENSDISANAFEGTGGNISINTETIFGIEFRDRLTPLSDITASSERGAAGQVIINTSGIEPTRGLESLTEERINVEVAQGCQVGTAKGGRVSFYNVGRGGLPPSPDDLFDSPMQGEWLSLESAEDNNTEPQTQNNSPDLSRKSNAIPVWTFSCSAAR
ncbi:MAG: filamentous hemagglutinin N-terminal domain-containing protein [Hydrococcus sp. Prado102]|nr:filamentous hemagglutinin N-terminal domain-containing protein [Hydrococcus sp. Prado102]